MDLIHRAEDAFRTNGVTPLCVPIRGGTDGARLSWDGLPCPKSFHRRLQLPRRAGVDTRRQFGRHGRRAGGSGVRLRAVNRGVSPPLFG